MIELLWNLVKDYGYLIRKKSEKVDGLAKWNSIKIKLAENKVEAKWIPKILNLYELMINQNIIEENIDPSNREIWEHHHVFIQHLRIPYKNQEPKENSLTR